MKTFKIIFSLTVISLLVFSCAKDSSNYPVKVRLTDGPGPYDSVFVDIQGVELTGMDGTAIVFDVNPGIYDLLQFSNGKDTLIATGEMDVATIEQIRLILGSENSVVVDGVKYPLSTPSAQQSGLKLQVHETLEAGVVYTILLDFDANKSIVNQGNGNYSLKPVIRTIQTAISGSIKGKITPEGTNAVVTVTDEQGESYTSNASDTGGFIVKGLPEGIYTLVITPESPYLEYIKESIIVTIGNTSDVGTIDLQQ